MLETRPQNNMLADLKDRWEDVPVNQKLVGVAVVCLLVATLVGLAAGHKSNDMVPLFGSLSPTQAAEMVQKLEEGNHRYQLADGGSLILVPEEDRQRLRLEMAGNGMLNQENPGFELFEKTTLSRSDFSERITYLRALQGELADTIEAIPQVRKARVHLNLPRRPLYLDEKQETSAAVYVELAPGASLNKNQMAGIINLVASSVEGMTPAQVTLMDGSGALHLRGDQLDEQGGVGGDDNDRSRELTNVAQELVDRVLGPGKAMATVRIELAREVRTTEREMVEPGNDGKGVLLHQEEQVETFEGTKPNPREEIAQGAAPVTTATAPAGEQANGKPPSYQQKSTKADFAVSRVKEVLETKP
ncbi:MAG: flagellar M-ring protein FliF, partial [Candidatus Eremiobacteraeota bacterium]|nr:flagellar M-ring protein FliF [Candidatus Eremiobacteraeota bacterium]